MHRCFLIAEVLQKIVAFLRADSGETSESKRLATIASLAVTCRTFYEIASDELWGQLLEVTPLVKCLPEEVLDYTTEGELTFKRLPLPNEWERFFHHAARVKTLEWTENLVHNNILSALSLYRPSRNVPLMPRLRELTWLPNGTNIQFIQLFLHPGLVDLSLSLPTTGSPSQDITAEKLAGILAYVEHTCKSLGTLSLRGFERVPGSALDEVASLFVPSLKKLREYSGDPIFLRDAVVGLAQMSTLSEARFVVCLNESVINALRDLDEPPFPSLRCIDVTFVLSTDYIARFLNLIHSSSCVRTSLRITCLDFPLDQLQEWMKEISKATKFNPLTRLSFILPTTTRPPAGVHGHRYNFTISILDPLLSITKLTHLDITSPYLQLNDARLKRLANALPNLRILGLLPGYSTRKLELVTIDGFISLIRACPYLESLGLPFDAQLQPYQLPSSLHHTSHRNDRLRLLIVADSPIKFDQSSFVALIMSGLFGNPKLDITIGHCQVGDWASPREREEYSKGWREVQKQTKYLMMARLSERSGAIVDASCQIPC